MVHRQVLSVVLALLIPFTSWAGDLGKDLRKAVEKNEVAKVHELLAKGADVNTKDKNAVHSSPRKFLWGRAAIRDRIASDLTQQAEFKSKWKIERSAPTLVEGFSGLNIR